MLRAGVSEAVNRSHVLGKCMVFLDAEVCRPRYQDQYSAMSGTILADTQMRKSVGDVDSRAQRSATIMW